MTRVFNKIAQKRRPMGEKKSLAILQEVDKLIDNFVKEIQFQTMGGKPYACEKE